MHGPRKGQRMRRETVPGWRPADPQADGLLVDMLTARLPLALIAEPFGVDVDTLRDYLERLDAAEHAPCP